MEKRMLLATVLVATVSAYTLFSFSAHSRGQSEIDVFYPLRYDRNRFTDVNKELHPESGDCHMMHNSNSCNTLPNYFVYPSTRPEYRKAAINFIHIAKTGGDTMRSCLRFLAEAEGLSPPVTVDFNHLCNQQSLRYDKDEINNRYGNIDITMGHCSVGMCDVIRESQPERKCSSFTILRDPFERMTSHYFYLRQCVNTSMVGNIHAMNSVRMSLADWALHTGSETRNKLFRQERVEQYPNGSKSCIVETEPMKTFENDSYVENILQNFDKHFGVIGLTSEYELTLKMLQKAYGIPFYDTCKKLSLNKGNYDNNKNDTVMKEIKANAVKKLKKNRRVKEMLHLDVKIYEKGKEIFLKQKEVMHLLS